MIIIMIITRGDSDTDVMGAWQSLILPSLWFCVRKF